MNCEQYYLLISWQYEYDKEGTWTDEDAGEMKCPLLAGEELVFHHIPKKPMRILTVEEKDGQVVATLARDTTTFTLTSDGEAVKHAIHDSYMVCGDFVTQDLYLTLSIVKES